jgi:hypothetical protein
MPMLSEIMCQAAEIYGALCRKDSHKAGINRLPS